MERQGLSGPSVGGLEYDVIEEVGGLVETPRRKRESLGGKSLADGLEFKLLWPCPEYEKDHPSSGSERPAGNSIACQPSAIFTSLSEPQSGQTCTGSAICVM